MTLEDGPEGSVDAGLLARQRRLPHWQAGGSYYFITFRSRRGELPPAARRIVLDCLLHGHGRQYYLVAATVMPDHVHVVLCPEKVGEGRWRDLSTILKPIKGVSARRINQLLGAAGSVWQDESWDRIIRCKEEFDALVWYIEANALKAGLVAEVDDYEFVVRRGAADRLAVK